MAFCTAYGTILHIKELNGSLGKCLKSQTECQTEISLICVLCHFFFSPVGMCSHLLFYWTAVIQHKHNSCFNDLKFKDIKKCIQACDPFQKPFWPNLDKEYQKNTESFNVMLNVGFASVKTPKYFLYIHQCSKVISG